MPDRQDDLIRRGDVEDATKRAAPPSVCDQVSIGSRVSVEQVEGSVDVLSADPVASAALALAEAFDAADTELASDPLDPFDRGPICARLNGLLAAYRAAVAARDHKEGEQS